MGHEGTDKLRIGIINIMPDTCAYHEELSRALQCVANRVELCWLRLVSRSYPAEARDFLEQHYQPYDQAVAHAALQGLILTGAPLELVAYEEVSYWEELRGILAEAVAGGVHTFGICWGGLALGKVLGLRKTVLKAKISGIYAATNLAAPGSPFSGLPGQLCLPFSIQAHLDTQDVRRQVREGKLTVAATLDALPHFLIHTADRRHFMCLGHPEYGPHRLVAEWQRDSKKNPATPPPYGVDLQCPGENWRALADQMFTAWVDEIALQAVRGRQVEDRPASVNGK